MVQTVDVEYGEIVVMGLKKSDDIGTEFSIDDKDISTISAEMIHAILPSPKFMMKKERLFTNSQGLFLLTRNRSILFSILVPIKFIITKMV